MGNSREQAEAMKVLITCAGSASAINLMDALRGQGDIPCRIIATDVDPLAAGLHLSDAGYVVPPSSDAGYVPALLQICSDHSVKALIPGLSNEYLALADSAAAFRALGVALPLSPKESLLICADKERVCHFLQSHGFQAPACYPVDEVKKGAFPMESPLIVKPRRGSSSRDTFIARSWREVEFFTDYVADPVVQEYIDGPEYTVDVLCDLLGRPLVGIPRLRLETRSGLAVKSETVDYPELSEPACAIAGELGLVGIVNLQCKIRGGKPVFFDINCRPAAGGLPLSVASGLNLPALLLRMLAGEMLDARCLKWRPGVIMTRYSTPLFLERQEDGSLARLEESFRPSFSKGGFA